MTDIHLSGQISDAEHQMRLDQALALLFTDYSRAQIQLWIKAGYVRVDDRVCDKVRHKTTRGSTVTITAPTPIHTSLLAQAIDVDTIFEDDDIWVINKPAGMVVHPGAGNPDGTLVNALLHHLPTQAQLPRAGLVHRLDKDTTGLLLIAKTPLAQKNLIDAMKARVIKRGYCAIVSGVLLTGGTIDAPIGRHHKVRTKMAVTPTGKPAVTHYRILRPLIGHTLVDVQLETGRTHQIRVHFEHIGHPLAGDLVYHRKIAHKGSASRNVQSALSQFRRQALHAQSLAFSHPRTGSPLRFEVGLPDDLSTLVAALS